MGHELQTRVTYMGRKLRVSIWVTHSAYTSHVDESRMWVTNSKYESHIKSRIWVAIFAYLYGSPTLRICVTFMGHKLRMNAYMSHELCLSIYGSRTSHTYMGHTLNIYANMSHVYMWVTYMGHELWKCIWAYLYKGRELHISIRTTHSAYMSHVYGSRNLNMYMRRELCIYVFITHELCGIWMRHEPRVNIKV